MRTLFILTILILISIAQIKSDFIISEIGHRPASCISDNGILFVMWDELEKAISFQKLDSVGNFIAPVKSFPETEASLFGRQAVNDSYLVSTWYDRISNQIHYFRYYIVGNIYNIHLEEYSENFMIQSRAEDPMDALRYNPDIAFLNDTTYVSVWHGEGGQLYGEFLVQWPGVYGRIGYTSGAFKDILNLVVSDHQLENVDYSEPRVISHPQSEFFTISWQDNHSGIQRIFNRIFYKNGTPKDSSFVVNEDSSLTGLYYLSLAMAPNGDYVIVWSAEKDDIPIIFWKWFTNEGIPITNSQQITTASDEVSISASVDVAIDKQGKVVVVWEGKQNVTITIFAKRYDENRNAIGESFKVSTRGDLTKSQIYPNVELRNNRIYTCWQENPSILGNILEFEYPVSISHEYSIMPGGFKLLQNYPNPFNPSTKISYSLSKPGKVKLIVFDVTGQELQILVDSYQQIGNYSVIFEMNNLSSGIYIYRLTVNGLNKQNKMLLIQ